MAAYAEPAMGGGRGDVYSLTKQGKELTVEPRAGAGAYLYPEEVAALLHVSTTTVSRWDKQGKLPHARTLGGHRRYPREAILFLAQRLEQGQ
jgi:excisionase family DNA binding protein